MIIRNQCSILVVEDNDEDFEAFMYAWTRSGATNEIHRCCDGQEALDYLERRGSLGDDNGSRGPGLILLDLNLVGIDGRQVLKRVKSDPRTARIPVMVLTTSANPKDIDFCYAAGANCYTIKPVDTPRFERLVALIKEFWTENIILPDHLDGLNPG